MRRKDQEMQVYHCCQSSESYGEDCPTDMYEGKGGPGLGGPSLEEESQKGRAMGCLV